MITQIMAFFNVELAVFPQLNTESMYLYHAYIIKKTHTNSPNWLRNCITKTK